MMEDDLSNMLLYTPEGFNALESVQEQRKQLMIVYGMCMSFTNYSELFFIQASAAHKLHIKINFADGQKFNQHQEKFFNHIRKRATLGMLIQDFQDEFVVDDIPEMAEMLKNFLHVRNSLVHNFVGNWREARSNQKTREDTYDNLLFVLSFLRKFNSYMLNLGQINSKRKPGIAITLSNK